MQEKCLILVVEDDPPVRNLITTTLEMQGYPYAVAENGQKALQQAASAKPDMILMDLGLPDIDGVQVIAKIRTWAQTPIIVISARGDDKDKIEALDAGADDYLTKPFSVDELLARIRATVRRLHYMQRQSSEAVFSNGGLEIDYTAATVKVDGNLVHLTPIEYNLLCLLAQNVGKVLTHQYILDKVWVNALESDLPSLRVFMATLRRKIEPDRANPVYIQTHVGIGYRMIKIEDEES